MVARFWSVLLLSFQVLALLGCDGLEDENDSFRPGYFKLAGGYELGDIKNTTPFVFNFLNGGDTDIVNITISSTNPAFVIDPAHIPILKPLSEQTLFQSLRIIAVHGTGDSGVGEADIMPLGENNTRLRITGKTTDLFGDTLKISQHAAVTVNALLVQVEIQSVQGVVPLENPQSTVLAGAVAPWFIKRYGVADGELRLLNTGNVNLKVRVYKRIGTAVYEEFDVELNPGAEVKVDRDRANIFFRIDSNNTISPGEILPIQPDGFIYLSFAPRM